VGLFLKNFFMPDVAVLGATGAVGQKVLALLSKNPVWTLAQLCASDQKAGCLYGDVTSWREPLPMPDIANIPLRKWSDVCTPYAISCLGNAPALYIEPALRQQGVHISSNASTFRMHADVPLHIQGVNDESLTLLKQQTTPGKLITNPNCSAVGIAMALKPLMSLGAIDQVYATTLQSLSGAGFSGPYAMDMLGNTQPHIDGEVDKIESEISRLLNGLSIQARVHRVPVLYGHTATLYVIFKQPVTLQAVYSVYQAEPYCLYKDPYQPQPRCLLPDDMRVHVGGLSYREGVLGLTVLTHNLVRGAAGAAIENLNCLYHYMQ
jgi:aspartate-semialdehyde dehydrogenase